GGVAAPGQVLVHERADLALDRFLPLPVELDVEVELAIHVGLLRDTLGAERVPLPDDEVGVLADVDRAGAVVDAELDRGVQRDEAERLLLAEAAPLDRLRGLLVEVAD